MQQIQLKPKVSGGKGGPLGAILGGVLGAIGGLLTGGAGAIPAAMAGMGAGTALGGTVGGAIDPKKVKERTPVSNLQSAAQEYPEVQAAELEEATKMVDTLPQMPAEERSILKKQFQEAKDQLLVSSNAMKELYGRGVR